MADASEYLQVLLGMALGSQCVGGAKICLPDDVKYVETIPVSKIGVKTFY